LAPVKVSRSQNQTRQTLCTPALIVDIDALDRNIDRMMRKARDMSVAVRPHAKAHKCVEIAQRLVRAGAIGASCSTIGEVELLVAGGVSGILITSPVVVVHHLETLQRLLARGASVAVVADHPTNLTAYRQIAGAAGRSLDVVVELDCGQGRTGCAQIADVVTLANEISRSSALKFTGVQAYWGHLQHIMPFGERVRLAGIQHERVRAAISALRAAGFESQIVTGGGTGTHAIDGKAGIFTEIQPGSFLFMDSCYGSITTDESENPFEASLFVAASVVSANHPGRVIVDAGFKAFATDSGRPVPSRGAPKGATYRYMGDEHGAVEFEGDSPAHGTIIEFLTSHCDPTVNLFPSFHVVRRDAVIDIWPIGASYQGS
jgi:3-hydroxy-D-aspartate aldolase